MSFKITESERSQILGMYGLLVEDKRPLQKLMECQFTPDGKYVVYEGNAYYTETGEEALLNESWSLSDILHTGADVLSAGLDFVIPGTGAIVDVLNALSYIIEAQFKSGKEKDSLYIMAAITFAFVILPGPLQAIAVPLKRAVKTGVGMTSKVVVKGLKIIGGSLKTLLTAIPKLINKALKSPLAKNILGKFGKKISSFLSSFTARITPLLEKITAGAGKVGKTTSKVASKIGGKISLRPAGKRALTTFFSKLPKIKRGMFFLRRMGFVPGKAYRYVGPSGKAMTGTIQKMTDNGVEILFKRGNRTWTTAVPVETFVKNAVGAPWLRRGSSVLVPLFVKRLSDVLMDDGNIDYDTLEKMEDLDPDTTSKESLDYMSEEVADYEGDAGQYSESDTVKTFQNTLMNLGYSLPRFGADGKFGPETQQALKKFQEDNNLTSSIGKMDRYTARKMSELLKSKNVDNSEDLQVSLNKI
jgi:hypothetical protein